MFPKLSETRIEILKVLSQGPSTPSELSKKLGRSLPTITRHLSYLERFDLITRIGEEKGKTRPHIKYALKDTVIMLRILEGDFGISWLSLNEYIRMRLGVKSFSNDLLNPQLKRTILKILNLLTKIEFFAIIRKNNEKSNKTKNTSFIIAVKNENIQEVKEKCKLSIDETYSSFRVDVVEFRNLENTLKRELEERKNIDLVPLYDPHKTLTKVKKEKNKESIKINKEIILILFKKLKSIFK